MPGEATAKFQATEISHDSSRNFSRKSRLDCFFLLLLCLELVSLVKMRKWDKLAPYPHSHHNRLAFHDRKLTPVMNLLDSTTDPFQIQLSRSHMGKIADTFEKDTMLRLRKVVDIQSRSPEMKALLREWEVAGQEPEAAEFLPDTSELSLDPFMDPFTKSPDEDLFSDGQGQGTGDSSWTSEESQTRDAVLQSFRMLTLVDSYFWGYSIHNVVVDEINLATLRG